MWLPGGMKTHFRCSALSSFPDAYPELRVSLIRNNGRCVDFVSNRTWNLLLNFPKRQRVCLCQPVPGGGGDYRQRAHTQPLPNPFRKFKIVVRAQLCCRLITSHQQPVNIPSSNLPSTCVKVVEQSLSHTSSHTLHLSWFDLGRQAFQTNCNPACVKGLPT